jgi:hypothetical protein
LQRKRGNSREIRKADFESCACLRCFH